MAQPTCPSCKGSIFQAATWPVAGLQHPQAFIICSKCGRILGVARGGLYDQQIMKISAAIKAIAIKQGVQVDL